MDTSGIRLKLSVLNLVNLLCVTGIFAASWIFYYNKIITWSYQYKGNLVVIFLFFVTYFLFIKIYDAFGITTHRKMELVISQLLAVFFADCIMFVVICLLHEWVATLWPMMLVGVAQVGVVLLWVVLTKNWYIKTAPRRRTVLLHDGSKEARHVQYEMGYDRRLDLIAAIDILDCLDANFTPLNDADTVFICADPGSERDAVVEYCTSKKINLFIVPSINDMLMMSAKHVHMYHTPLLQMHMSEPSLVYVFLKRAMDIFVSLCGILILWPLMIVVAIAIKSYDHGPAFYKQVRLTKDGKKFELIKFRSMRTDAEADGVARLSTGDNDDRITPIGKFIRKCRIDELPQILNIFVGDMSIVGPRPERPEIAVKYEETLPEFRQRLQVKAGLTGYAQVYGKYNSTPREKLQMDMIYISRANFLEDLRLMFETLRILFIKESTEGFDSLLVSTSENKK